MDFGLLGAGAALGIAALGSAIGIGTSGTATIGAWKRCYLNNKPAPFILTVFAGAPLTQTIYGYLVMMFMMDSTKNPWYLAGLGVCAGLAMAFSAIAQGKAGAAGSDAFGETGKGFSQYITIVGLCETVALFVMVFALISV
ncbi:MAG: V-type ATP synthase subunit K [Spirochaetales bacterium]